MIAIVNQQKKNDKGETLYLLKINSSVIASFYHLESDGLTKCLEHAMYAARFVQMIAAREHFNDIANGRDQ